MRINNPSVSTTDICSHTCVNEGAEIQAGIWDGCDVAVPVLCVDSTLWSAYLASTDL